MKTWSMLAAALIAAAALPVHARDENERGAGGAFWGSIIGGYLGSNVGQGRGRTAATIAGAIVGAGVGDRIQNGDPYEQRGQARQYQQQYVPPPGTYREYQGGYSGYRGGYYELRQPSLRSNGDTVSLD